MIQSGVLHLTGMTLSSTSLHILTVRRTDIFVITYSQTGYRFDASLNLKQTFSLRGYCSNLSCHGFHSNLLVCGNIDGSIQLFDTQQGILFKQIRLGNETISDISMNEKFIIAGTIGGAVHLRTHTGVYKYNFKTNDYIHSVSVSDSTILAATRGRVYIWNLDKRGRPYNRQNFALDPTDEAQWACFNPFGHPGKAPFLIGSPGRWPKWERQVRPIIKRIYGSTELEYALSISGKEGKRLKIRNLESKRLIRTMILKETPRMLWSDHESIFVVYSGAKWVEMTDVGNQLSIAHGRACLESVSLLLPDGSWCIVDTPF
jgi:WD40 repeat protein